MDAPALPADVQAQLHELQQRESALTNLELYRQYIAPSAHADFSFPPATHHQLIQQELDQLLDNPDLDGIIIMAPPGSAKSTYASVQFPTHYWAKHPTHNVLAASNTQDLAVSFNKRRKSTIQSAEWSNLTGHTLDKDSQANDNFQNTAGGTMRCVGVSSSVAGYRADLLVLDDPIAKVEDVSSPAALDKQWDWWQADFLTRLKPNGKIVVIMTRWSRKDIAGRIIDQIKDGSAARNWAILRLPMEADQPDDPLNRELHQPLWPEWYTDSMMTEAKQNHYNWLSLYQQTPQDKEGTWVDDECIQIVQRSAIPNHVTYLTAVDLALSSGHGDYTAIITAALDQNRNLYVVDVHRLQVAVGEALRKIEAVVAQYQPTLVLVEDSPAEKTMMSVLREYARHGDISIPFYTLPIRGKSKEERAAPIRNWFMEERVFLIQSGWTGELTKEIANFPPKSKTEHDDMIDALGLIGRHLGKTSTPNQPKTLKQQLKTTQDMCLNDLFTDHAATLNASSRNRARI